MNVLFGSNPDSLFCAISIGSFVKILIGSFAWNFEPVKLTKGI